MPAEKLFTSISNPGLILPSQIESTFFINHAASGPMIIAPMNIGSVVLMITPIVATTPTTAPRTPYTIRPPCAAIRIGSMYRTIGPTRPGFGSPASSTPNPPITAIGNGPFSMNNAVMKPHAMNAAIFGMIIPDRNVPNFCTATRLLLVLLAGAASVLIFLIPFLGSGRVDSGPRACRDGPLPGFPVGHSTSRSTRSGPDPGREAWGDRGPDCTEL